MIISSFNYFYYQIIVLFLVLIIFFYVYWVSPSSSMMNNIWLCFLYLLISISFIQSLSNQQQDPHHHNHHNASKQFHYRYYERIVELYDNTTFLVTNDNHLAHEIYDNTTKYFLEIPIVTVNLTREEFSKTIKKIGQKVPPLIYRSNSPDDLIRFELDKLRILSPSSLVKNAVYVGDYINPSILPFEGRYLILGEIFKGRNQPERVVGFNWFNHSTLPYDSKDNFLGISSQINNITYISGTPPGQDPRVLLLPNNTLLYMHTNFLSERPYKHLRMGSAMLSFKEGKPYVHNVFFAMHPDHTPKTSHKNWNAFMYQNELFVLENINPILISKFDYITSINFEDKLVDEHHMKTVYQPEMPRLKWNYGSIHGGTNPVAIDDHHMILFFHSSKKLLWARMTTYFFGALIIQAHPPFAPVAMSPYPIIHEPFYLDAWCCKICCPYPIDYVNFPTHLFLENNNQDIVISMGRQDREAWLVTFGINDLLNTLRPVE